MSARLRHAEQSLYSGDSAAKKVARLRALEQVVTQLQLSAFLRGKYLALAGEEAGDASVLSGLGVADSSIVLCDIRQGAAEKAKKRAPAVTVYAEDVEKTASRFPKGAFSGIVLDYCGNISDDLLALTKKVADRGLDRRHGCLVVTVMVGREKKDYWATIEALKEGEGREVSFLARAQFLADFLLEHCGMHPLHYVGYSAGGDRPTAVPMCTYVGSRKPPSSGPTYSVVDATEKDLGPLALQLLAEGRDPCRLLNVSRNTLSAWKAHGTRGTYP